MAERTLPPNIKSSQGAFSRLESYSRTPKLSGMIGELPNTTTSNGECKIAVDGQEITIIRGFTRSHDDRLEQPYLDVFYGDFTCRLRPDGVGFLSFAYQAIVEIGGTQLMTTLSSSYAVSFDGFNGHRQASKNAAIAIAKTIFDTIQTDQWQEWPIGVVAAVG